jgi:hypothetical protein
MLNKTAKTGRKQLSRGQRTHVRRLKQEARHAGTVYRSPFGVTRVLAAPKKDTKAPPNE